MILNYHKQQKDYWCGPASVQMVLGCFGIRVPQRTIARLARTKFRTGTTRKNIQKILERFGLHTSVKSRALLSDIQKALFLKMKIIVLFREPSDNELHYSVVRHLNKKSIILADPWNGSHCKLSKPDFFRRWSAAGGRSTRWLVVISPLPSKNMLQ
ncbi:MAG: cysteine peptidase family C39 domain-containing protein [Patescibacteria group bacterium]|jgi:ABC-type bacteriocin/lantibiotic exporter with double-glycine peptidase domain